MDIYNATASLPPAAFAAFARPPRKVTLKPGDTLYRYASIVDRTFGGNDTFGSPWWITGRTYHQISKIAHRTGQPRIEVARAHLAVARAWNPKMDWLMTIELKRSVYAWIGPASAQAVDGRDRSVLLLGHGDQAYVPGLAAPESMASDAAVLTYFGSADL